MASATQPLPRRPRLVGPKKTFAIVASMYNEEYVNGLLEALKNELLAIMPSASVPLYHVPGAWEIPVTAEYVLEYARADVLVAVGVILQGETAHANLIATSVCQKLQDMATEHLTPIINCVLCMNDEQQAKERCLGSEMNRGTEAARAALNMAELFVKLQAA
ncbi:MAG: 6,7-dimethyl-8-ribityllumazine synthase, partial [Verrucomicrobiales bacterium]|nr:6,7-dimethyl-8-ribityllumazine synthase [Verrucomicrobiales bacterium]